MKPQKFIPILLGILCLAFTLTPQAGDLGFFTGTSKDLNQERIFAAEHNKKGLLIFYGTPHCPFCQRMKKTVLNQPEIQNFFKENFHLLEINILDEQPISDFSGDKTTSKQFSESNHIRVTPTLIFYNLKGERLFKQAGIIADPQEFRWLGEYVLEEGYSRESFGQYKRNKRTSR